MHARVFTFQLKQPEMIDTIYQSMQDGLLPISKQFPGFTDALHLTDRQTGRIITITIWETEADARSFAPSEEQIQQWTTFAESFAALPTDEVWEMLI